MNIEMDEELINIDTKIKTLKNELKSIHQNINEIYDYWDYSYDDINRYNHDAYKIEKEIKELKIIQERLLKIKKLNLK